MASANARNVRRVPTSGIKSSADTSVPNRLPAVDSAYSRPATWPACSTLSTASRRAHGETAPKSSTGTATRTSTATSEPKKAPAEISSSASTATSSSGSAANGTTASSAAAARVTRQRPRIVGLRSAHFPPSQYPTDSATSTTPIVFAHTTVDAPKYGASRRTAAISAPSEPVPTTNTSSGSGGIPTCTIASVELVPDALRDADRKHVWHPFTQQLGWASEDAPIIERAEGTELIDVDGRRYIDGVSSLWCTVHGHRHPRIDAAVKEQLDRVAHSTMLGLTHPAAIELAERLAGIAPPGLSRVFYSDSGSTATEIALKMAFQYWQQQGGDNTRKTRFVSLRHAYHGDTVGSVSVGGIDLFHAMYRPLLFDTLKVDPGDADELDFVLSGYEGEVAAVIVEPLVQGAAGMIMQPDGYLAQVRELCDRYGVLLICDEVATGFGRTGRMFACEHEGVSPDLLCVAKGLTGGYLPLAATLATEAIYEGFLGQFHEFRTFFHGHTYTGNPLACAAALATLRLLEDGRIIGDVPRKARVLREALAAVEAHRHVGEVRQAGLMCGIELVADRATRERFAPADRVGHHLGLALRAHGVFLRPLGDVLVVMPALTSTDDELRHLAAGIHAVLLERFGH